MGTEVYNLFSESRAKAQLAKTRKNGHVETGRRLLTMDRGRGRKRGRYKVYLLRH